MIDEKQKFAYSINELIIYTGLCRQLIYNEINAGRLQTFMVGTRRLISPDAVNKWREDLEKQNNN